VANGRALRHFRANSLEVAQACSRAKKTTATPQYKLQTTLTRACGVAQGALPAAATASWPLNAQSGGCPFGVFNAKTAANARRVLCEMEQACPIRIQTKHGQRQGVHGSALAPAQTCRDRGTGAHEFDRPGIDCRLTAPKSPRTNGMAAREGGRIGAVLQKPSVPIGCGIGAHATTAMSGFTTCSSPQSAPESKTPLQMMQNRRKLKPELFQK